MKLEQHPDDGLHEAAQDKPKTEDVHMLTITQVAEYVEVSERTVRRWIKSGDLAAHLFGRQWRIARHDLKAFLQSHRVEP